MILLVLTQFLTTGKSPRETQNEASNSHHRLMISSLSHLILRLSVKFLSPP